MKNDIKTLSHSTYRCQYHIVFAPKYRRKAIYGELKRDIGQILRISYPYFPDSFSIDYSENAM